MRGCIRDYVAVVCAVLVTGIASCGGDPAVESQTGAALRRHAHTRTIRTATTTTSTATTTSTGTTTPSSGTTASGTTASGTTAPTASAPAPAPATGDAQAIIAAAQTPDGAAIPQASGPNGECPAVVTVVGFWSCPALDLDDMCTYSADGVTHHCTCVRVDGEGQLPNWLCN